jgi:transcriptional regulator with XRE-family HTH domain
MKAFTSQNLKRRCKKMLKEVMRKRGMSQAQMARMADINQTQFNRAYNGYQEFFPAWKKRISEVLNIEKSELFPDDNEKGRMENE